MYILWFNFILGLNLIIWASPNSVIEFACFDSKLQQARNACERKQAKRRECLPRAVPEHGIYLFYTRPTDNARQTNRQQKTNFLEKQGTLNETNY